MTTSALRACSRVAWRQARRAPGRAALVIAMIALPVTALTLGATLIQTSVPTLEEYVSSTMGSAELLVNTPVPLDTAALEARLPRGSRVVSIEQWNHTLVVRGSVVYASVFEPSVRIDQPPIPGLYQLLRGRAPSKPGEAAVDPYVLDVFGVDVGDDVTIGERTFRVVGVAARPEQMFGPLLVLAPGTLGAGGTRQETLERFVNSLLIDLPRGAGVDEVKETIRAFMIATARGANNAPALEQLRAGDDTIRTRAGEAATRIDDKARLTSVSFAGTAVALFATGLIAAAAFSVGIRRQLRLLGLLAAAGGEPRHVRAVVTLGGTTLGCAGAAAGIAAGVGGAYGLTPHLSRFTHALPGAVNLNIPVLLGAGLLGVVAATCAAAWPARLAVRIPTLDALASRMPSPRPPGRLARAGLLVAAAGAALTGLFLKENVVVTAGVVMTVGGFLVAVPWLVWTAGRLAPHLPTASRLAVRETARHGHRTGAAIAVAALALIAPIAITAVSLSEESYQARTAMIGPDHLLIGNQLADVNGRPRPLPAGLASEIRRALPRSIVASQRGALLDLKRHPPVGGPEPPPDVAAVSEYVANVEGPEVTIQQPGGPAARYRKSAQLMIGDAETLRALHAEDGIPALDAGMIVGIGPNSIDHGIVRLVLFSYKNEPPRIELKAVEAGSITYSNDLVPAYVVSLAGAKAIGVREGDPNYYRALVRAPGPLTGAQIRAIKEVVAHYPGAFVQTRADFLPHFGAVRLAATAGAAAIALAIVAVVIALIGAEGRRDQAILVAVGAGSRARRRISAVRAGLITLLAAVIAIPAGFTPVAVVQSSRPHTPGSPGFPIVVPWLTIAVVVLGVPLIAAAFAWLTSRAPKSSAMLNPVA